MGWVIDPAHTTVGFSVKHMGLSTVRGRFTRFSGEIDLDDPTDLTSATGTIRVELSSIDTGNEQRDTHLRSGDFFNAEKNPEMTFELRSIQPQGDTFAVQADLTINGTTKPVTLTYEHGGEATDPYGNRKVGGTLTGTIDRRDWGIVWNVPLAGGGLLVGEKVKIEVEGEIAEELSAVEHEVELEASRQMHRQPAPAQDTTE